MVRNLLVTGGSGFLGTTVVKQLLEESANVYLTLRPSSRMDTEIRNRVSVTETKDIFKEDYEWWANTLNGIDTVVHLAWDVGNSYRTDPTNISDCLGTLRLVEAIKRAQVRHFVGIGSCLEYRRSVGPLGGLDDTEPDTIYGAAKLTTYVVARKILEDTPITATWCRLFYVHGERRRANALVPRVIDAFQTGKRFVVESPNSIIDFLDVVEAGRRIVSEIREPREAVLNVCSGDGRSVRSLVEELRREAKYPEAVSYRRIEDQAEPEIWVGVPTWGADGPVTDSKVGYTEPSINNSDVSAVTKATATSWGSQRGQYVKLFEKQFASLMGVEFALSTSSATGALHLVLAAMGLTANDEVILADTNWIATLAPIVHLNATPVFVDVEDDTLCIDPQQIRQKVTNKTKVIVATHLYGNLCDMDEVKAIAKLNHLLVVEDAAEALGSYYKERHAGTLGDAGVFSFHGSKTMTTGEGGMIVTDDAALHKELRILAEHGRSPFVYNSGTFLAERIGFKYKMTDLQAALGLSQLKRFYSLVKRKRDVLENYRELLKFEKKIALNSIKPNCVTGAWLPVVRWDESYGIQSDYVANAMATQGVEARHLFRPLSTLDLGYKDNQSLVGKTACLYGITLPSYHGMTDTDQVRVVNVLLEILSR
ncbi:aminotransferase class V-fold PLP-dependent enzyme [Gammaproteobacteria bacterium]|nr:aminotransferase class V-fold PLP-dependent enzyme [Gammaproteobacteria bacterium]